MHTKKMSITNVRSKGVEYSLHVEKIDSVSGLAFPKTYNDFFVKISTGICKKGSQHLGLHNEPFFALRLCKNKCIPFAICVSVVWHSALTCVYNLLGFKGGYFEYFFICIQIDFLSILLT